MMVLFSLLTAAALAQEPAPAQPLTEEAVQAPDRSSPPEVLPAQVFDLPAPQVSQLAPGVELQLISVPGVRKVEVMVVQHRGSLDLDQWPTPATEVLGWIQDAATQRWGLAELAQHKDLHDIQVRSWVDFRDTGARLEVPRENLDEGLEVLQEVLQHPTFPKAEIKRVRRQNENFVLVEGPTDPRSIASAALSYGWFGPEHPFGARPDMTAWKKVKPPRLLDLHAQLAQAPITVLVVGDLTLEEVQAPLQQMLQGLGGEGAELDEPAFSAPEVTRILAVDLAGAEQVQVALRLDAPVESHPDRGAYEMVDFSLGGAFLSRINTNLREEKGLTYGAYSRYRPHQTRAHWTLRFDTAVDQTALAVGEVEKELALLVESGLTPAELDQARNSLVSEYNDTLQTADSAMSFYSGRLEERESVDQARDRELARADLSVEDSTRVAGEWFAPQRPRLWVLVGDRGVLEGQISKLGWDVEWLQPDQVLRGEF